MALDLQSNFRGSAEDIACFLKKIKSLRLSKDSIYFYLGLLVKLIYSRLVDADRTDAACFETRKQYGSARKVAHFGSWPSMER